MVQILLFFMGMFFDWLAILLLAGPVVFPIMASLGFDMVWFGAIFVMNMQMSYLTPPLGSALIYLKGVTPPETTMGDLIRSAWPFLILQIIGLVFVAVFPQIALWLPGVIVR